MPFDVISAINTIRKIVGDIKKAVKNADFNMEYCLMIDKLVDGVSTVVNQNQNISDEESEALRRPMNDLVGALWKACDLITRCRKQDKKVISRAYNAADTAKELQLVNMEICNSISTLQMAKSFRDSALLRNMQQQQRSMLQQQRSMQETQGDMLQLLVVRLDAPQPQGQEVAGLVQTSRISYSTNAATRSPPARSKVHVQNDKVLARGKNPADFLAAAGLERYSFQRLRTATSDFKQEIGQGDSGHVYKGELDGVEVAIKDHFMYKFEPSTQMVQHLFEEFKLHSTLEHKNIIELLGCHLPGPRGKGKGKSPMYNDFPQIEEDNRFLSVSRYMPKGSLASIIIDDKAKGQKVDWASLVRIIQGIAEGVLYLHEQRIFHLDLKPSHILVDSDMTPKINDFRTAAVLVEGVDDIDIESLTGPLSAYIAPEQKYDGKVSTMSDVYSFGVIVLETLGCICKSQDPAGVQLVSSNCRDPSEWLTRVQHSDWKDIIDETRVTDEFERMVARWFLTVALRCCVRVPGDRPSMSEVVDMLHAVSDTKPRHEILTQDDLRQLLQQNRTKVVNALKVPLGVAERLLLCCNWTPETVIEKWSSNREAACREIGLRSSDDRAMKLDQVSGICNLCDNGLCNRKSTGSCDHYFCQECWGKYIHKNRKAIGSLCLHLQCPDRSCNAPVVREVIEGMAQEDDKAWYDKFALRSYVDDGNGMIKWCPGPGCDRAIKFHGCVGNAGVDVVCDRNHSFRCRCYRRESHQPETSDTMAQQCLMLAEEDTNPFIDPLI